MVQIIQGTIVQKCQHLFKLLLMNKLLHFNLTTNVTPQVNFSQASVLTKNRRSPVRSCVYMCTEFRSLC